jgi:aspartate aminotransferase
VREQVAAHFSEEMGLRLTREQVAIVCGGNAALTSSVATLAGPGDEVVLPVPHYPPSPSQIELSGAVPVLVRSPPGSPRLTPELLVSAVTTRTAAVLLTSPTNPTGVIYTARELAALNDVLPPRVAWIVDEAYVDVVHDGRERPCAATMLRDTEREWLVVRTASKTVGRPGLRAAVVIGTASTIARLETVLVFTAGAAGSFAQTALYPALQAARAATANPYEMRLALVLSALAGSELRPLRPEGTYYLWVRGRDSGEPIGSIPSVAHLCDTRATYVSPGILYGDERGVRLSLSCSPRELRVGTAELAAHAQSLLAAAPS